MVDLLGRSSRRSGELGREVVKSEEVIAALSESPARALAYAAQLVRSRPQWKHPYYWAAFQANGLAYAADEPELTRRPTDATGHIEKSH
jgi:hypothetical protein